MCSTCKNLSFDISHDRSEWISNVILDLCMKIRYLFELWIMQIKTYTFNGKKGSIFKIIWAVYPPFLSHFFVYYNACVCFYLFVKLNKTLIFKNKSKGKNMLFSIKTLNNFNKSHLISLWIPVLSSTCKYLSFDISHDSFEWISNFIYWIYEYILNFITLWRNMQIRGLRHYMAAPHHHFS